MNSDICYVYWIHLPEHTDMTTQGYIGITFSPTVRLKQHILKSAKGAEYYKPEFAKALVTGNYIYEILICSNREYCYDLEFKLRPKWDIGWNNARGGIWTGNGALEYLIDDKYVSLEELATVRNIKPNTIYQRIRRGWNIQEACGLRKRKPIKDFNYKAEMAIYLLENTPMTCAKIADKLNVKYNLKRLLKNYRVPKYLFDYCEVLEQTGVWIRRIPRSKIFEDFSEILDIEEQFQNGVCIYQISNKINITESCIRKLLEDLENG